MSRLVGMKRGEFHGIYSGIVLELSGKAAVAASDEESKAAQSFVRILIGFLRNVHFEL